MTMQVRTGLLLAMLITATTACSDSEAEPVTGAFAADVWADNWFAMYVGDTLVAEDSVSITTERSFNAERFGFDASYPFTINMLIKDYKENDTGLEYIGESNQQMGDGGVIIQVADNDSGDMVAVSSSAWKCLAIHQAPLDKSCEKSATPEVDCTANIIAEPSDWKADGFDSSSWQAASEFSEAQVSPKDGYDEVSWDSSAKLIWTSDLETDNTLLCTLTVVAP